MVREYVESIAFYPKDEFPAYMFAQITKILGNGTSFSDLNSRGKAKLYYYYAGDVRRLRDDGFFEYDNIYWSGDESGGMIRGNGVGLAINDRWVCFFQGRFEEGWPNTHGLIGKDIMAFSRRMESFDGMIIPFMKYSVAVFIRDIREMAGFHISAATDGVLSILIQGKC